MTETQIILWSMRGWVFSSALEGRSLQVKWTGRSHCKCCGARL